MEPSSRTPEGVPNRCPMCAKEVRIEPSRPRGDAPCPHCGHLLWFDLNVPEGTAETGRRLDFSFQHAQEQSRQGNYDYARELFAQCVLSEPSNLLFVRCYLENLHKKYGNNRKGKPLGFFTTCLGRNALKQAVKSKQWEAALRHGLEILAVNPWDVEALRCMAAASEPLGHRECGLYYLRCALEASPNDPETRKRHDAALARWKQRE